MVLLLFFLLPDGSGFKHSRAARDKPFFRGKTES
jgi:hypothetical protein